MCTQALPNPFLMEPFIIDEDQFLLDCWGEHNLPEAEPIEDEYAPIRELLAKYC